jgi:hypothetical protein
VAAVVGPDELQGANTRAEKSDGENQMDVGVVDFDHLEKKLVLMVDVHRRLQSRAVVDDLVRDGVQQTRGGPRLQPGDQQLRQAPLMQPNRVSERSSVAFDVLDRPPVILDGLPQGLQVIVGGGLRVIALPAHAVHLSVADTDQRAPTHRQISRAVTPE